MGGSVAVNARRSGRCLCVYGRPSVRHSVSIRSTLRASTVRRVQAVQNSAQALPRKFTREYPSLACLAVGATTCCEAPAGSMLNQGHHRRGPDGHLLGGLPFRQRRWRRCADWRPPSHVQGSHSMVAARIVFPRGILVWYFCRLCGPLETLESRVGLRGRAPRPRAPRPLTNPANHYTPGTKV